MSTQVNRELEIFSQALERRMPEQRAAYLDEACSGDGELRRRLAELLQAHDKAGGFLPHVTQATESFQAGAGAARVTESVGDRIGRYKIRERIGEGGCGVVYVAEQEEPVRRRVALKIIKLGMDTKSVIARFEAERQALAMMDHPNIARVLDAGATETGRPYFVMELVRGIRITEYCDQHKLSTGARLDLFIKVCQAVQHAHQKGIIHRDLKPSNILVTLHDGVPVPKIIDFGIAKATEGRLTEQTVYTELHQFIGTPAYMSPEQAEMSGLDIDTRSDIYSLGVLLYELLTGETPFDAKELLKSGLDAMRKTIREMEPSRPSTRLSGMEGALLTTTAQRRGAEVPRLVSAIQGDLDWIVMKCLEKDRTRRYETANGLATDLKRHLINEPVVARPPSTMYRLQKAIRRNRLAFGAATGVVLALGLGVVASTWQAVRATRAEREQSRLAASEGRERLAAQASEKLALSAKTEAEAAKGQAEALAYAADMNMAQRALLSNNLAGARQLLELHRPKAGSAEVPAWEWRYLWQQCRTEAPWKMWQSSDASDFIAAISNSPDDHWLLMASIKSGTRLWDISNPHAMRKVRDLGKDLENLAFSPKDALFAIVIPVPDSTPKSFQIQIWNAATNSLVKTLPMGQDEPAALEFTEDGKRLVVATENEGWKLKILSVPDGETVGAYDGGKEASKPGYRSSIKLIDHSNVCIVAEDMLRAIDLRTFKEIWTSPMHAGVWGLTATPDGTRLVTMEAVLSPGNSATFTIWVRDTSTGKPLGEPVAPPQGLFDLQMLPDGKSFVTANTDQTLRMWDMSDPAHIQPKGDAFRGHTGVVTCCTILSDGKTMYSGGIDGAVLGWDLTAARDRAPYKLVAELKKSWDFSRDGKSAFMMDDEGKFWRMEGKDFSHGTVIVDAGGKVDMAGSDYDRRLVTARNGTLKLWDLATGKMIKEFGSYQGGIGAVNLSSDGTDLIYSDQKEKMYHQWDLVDFHEKPSYPFFSTAQAIRTNPDHKTTLVFTSSTGELTIWDRVSDKKTTKQLMTQAATNITFSTDGKYLAVGTMQGTLDVFDVTTLQRVSRVGDSRLPIVYPVISPDGQRVLFENGWPSDSLQVWDIRTQREVMSLPHPANAALAAKLSPDGRHIALPFETGTYLWEAPTWEEIQAAERALHP